MQFFLPSFETVCEIHDIILDESGGLAGMPHPEYIQSALHRPQNYMDYDSDCDIHLVAALVLDGIVRNHAFADGNKRTALITMLMVYNLNSHRHKHNKMAYSLRMNSEFEALVVDVAEKRPDITALRSKLGALIEEF